MKKIKYPDIRKPRRTDYSKSHKLISQLGKEALIKVFENDGIYNAAKILTEMVGWPVSSDLAYYVRRYKLNLRINHNEKNKPNPEAFLESREGLQ